MFKQEGNFRGIVLDTRLAKSRFNKDPKAFDVCLQIQGPNAPDGTEQIDWWHGEVSTKIAQQGNVKGMAQSDITAKELAKVGFVGSHFGEITMLKGLEIDFTVKSRKWGDEGQNTAYDIKYLGASDFAPTALDSATAAALLAQYPVNGAAAAPAPVAPAAAPVAPVAAAPAPAPVAAAPAPAPVAPAAAPAMPAPAPVAPAAAPAPAATTGQGW